VPDKLRAIIFDIGRVLVRVDIRRAQLSLADGLKLTPEELWSAIENDPRWLDWQTGRISPRDWHLNLSQRLGMTLGFAQFTAAWNSALDPNPIHPDSLFEKLGKSYRLGLLSNTDPLHVAFLEKTYRFFRYFPKPVRIYSCSVGACKPDPLIFSEALRACKVSANQAVYIDDIPAFVQAAEALGCKGIPYRSSEDLRKQLEALGIESI
jgi:HAD superfamily hydrolase (TIGR01509 family)